MVKALNYMDIITLLLLKYLMQFAIHSFFNLTSLLTFKEDKRKSLGLIL